jgi:hypothetical protein
LRRKAPFSTALYMIGRKTRRQFHTITLSRCFFHPIDVRIFMTTSQDVRLLGFDCDYDCSLPDTTCMPRHIIIWRLPARYGCCDRRCRRPGSNTVPSWKIVIGIPQVERSRRVVALDSQGRGRGMLKATMHEERQASQQSQSLGLAIWLPTMEEAWYREARRREGNPLEGKPVR